MTETYIYIHVVHPLHANEDTRTPWTASQPDMLSEDWAKA